MAFRALGTVLADVKVTIIIACVESLGSLVLYRSSALVAAEYLVFGLLIEHTILISTGFQEIATSQNKGVTISASEYVACRKIYVDAIFA